MTEPQTPQTEAGRTATRALSDFREWSSDPNVKRVLAGAESAILAIEAQAREQAAGPEGLTKAGLEKYYAIYGPTNDWYAVGRVMREVDALTPTEPDR